MLIDISAQDLYNHLKNTNITRIFFTVELSYKEPSDDTRDASDRNNHVVKLCIAAYSANENHYNATIDFTDFDEVGNRIMAKSVPLLLALNQNSTLQRLIFKIVQTQYSEKSHNFFNIFCTEMFMRMQTNNKPNLFALSIYGDEEERFPAKEALSTSVIKFIEKTPGLKSLMLTGMNLWDDDVKPILKFLRDNKIMLTELELTNNNLSDVAIKQVFKYLREARSLVSLNLSGQAFEIRFILDESLFQYLLSTLSVLSYRMDYLGLANLSIDDCAFQCFADASDIVVNKIRHLDVSDNELSHQMIAYAEHVFKKPDLYFNFQYDECYPETILYGFMWNDKELIHILLDECAQSELSDIDSNENTPAHYLAQQGNLEGLKRLKKIGALLKEENHYGFTPLHMAIEYGQLSVVHWFIHAVKPNDIHKGSFVMALAASNNIAMFNLLKAELKNRFTKFLNLTYNELTFCHLLAIQGAVTLLSYVLETKIITKTQLEARCRLKKDDQKAFSPFMLGLVVAKINTEHTVEFFKFMISQKVNIESDDSANFMAYVKKSSDKLSSIQETLYDQTQVYQNLKTIFDAIWREYAIVFDDDTLSFTLTLSQTGLHEKFKVSRNFSIILNSVLKHLFRADVDSTHLCVFGENNTAMLTIIKSDLNQKMDIDGLKHDLIALGPIPRTPNPSEKVKQKNKEARVSSPKLELKIDTPPPSSVLTTITDTTCSSLALEAIVYQSKDLFKRPPQKKAPALSKQNLSHGQGKNSKNLKRREKYNKKIEKEAAKEQLKLQREQHRLQKEAERAAKAKQKSEGDRLAQQAYLAEEARLAGAAREATIPKLKDVTQSFFYQKEPCDCDDDSDGEELLKVLDDELMKLKAQMFEDINRLGF